MTDITSLQTQLAGDLIQAVMMQSQQAQMDLATKMVRVSMAMKLQAPPGTAAASGAGGLVDMVT